MSSFSSSAFSTSSFSESAFDFRTAPAVTAIVGDSDWINHDPSAQRALWEHKQAQERQRIKEEEIIRLRLEAQATLLQKREIEASTAIQDKRRYELLEAQYLALQDALMAQLVALEELRLKTVKYRNNVIMLLFQAACPFTSITFH